MSGRGTKRPLGYSARPPYSRAFRPGWLTLSKAFHLYSCVLRGHFYRRLRWLSRDRLHQQNILSFPPWHSESRHRPKQSILRWSRATLRFRGISNSGGTGRRVACKKDLSRNHRRHGIRSDKRSLDSSLRMPRNRDCSVWDHWHLKDHIERLTAQTT